MRRNRTSSCGKLRKRVHAESVLVSSTAAAIEAMDRGIPDLILVSALLSPRDEDRLMAHLRSLEGAAHLQTLTIPQLAAGSKHAEQKTAFGRFRKRNPPSLPVPAAIRKCSRMKSWHTRRAAEIRKRPQVELLFTPVVGKVTPEPVLHLTSSK